MGAKMGAHHIMVFGSGSHHDSHLNSSIFQRKFFINIHTRKKHLKKSWSNKNRLKWLRK